MFVKIKGSCFLIIPLLKKMRLIRQNFDKFQRYLQVNSFVLHKFEKNFSENSEDILVKFFENTQNFG